MNDCGRLFRRRVHSFRHTPDTCTANAGVSAHTIREILGHTPERCGLLAHRGRDPSPRVRGEVRGALQLKGEAVEVRRHADLPGVEWLAEKIGRRPTQWPATGADGRSSHSQAAQVVRQFQQQPGHGRPGVDLLHPPPRRPLQGNTGAAHRLGLPDVQCGHPFDDLLGVLRLGEHLRLLVSPGRLLCGSPRADG